MSENMKIEELLNSFVDGELTVRQRTEVKRIAANDPDIASRLRQLQKCKILVNALPTVQAPSKILDNVKSSLEAKAYLNEQAPVYNQPGKTRFVLLHRIMAAAAMIGIATILVIMANMFLPKDAGDGHIGSIADVKFSGKLELKTNEFVAFNSVINKAIEDNGLSESLTEIKESNRRIYTLKCSREGLNRFLADLDSNWNQLDSATFAVDTKVFGENLQVDEVTARQISEIVNQADTNQSIKVARDFAVMNSIAELLPDSEILSSGKDIHTGLITIPKPHLTSDNQKPTQQEDGEKTVQLRIILSR